MERKSHLSTVLSFRTALAGADTQECHGRGRGTATRSPPRPSHPLHQTTARPGCPAAQRSIPSCRRQERLGRSDSGGGRSGDISPQSPRAHLQKGREAPGRCQPK